MKSIIKKHLKSFVIFAVLVIICNVLNVLHPYIVKQVLDVDFSNNDFSKNLYMLFICYAIIHITFAIMKNIRNIQSNKIMAKVLKEIREKVFCKVLKFKMKTFNKYKSAEIYTRLTVDTENLFDLFFGFIQIMVNNVIYILFMIAMMFFADIHLGVIGCSTVILISIISFNITKKLKKLDNKILDQRDAENREYSEIYNKSKLTYLFNLQKDNIKRTHDLLNEELKNRKKYIFIHSFSGPLEAVISAIGIYVILYYALNINLNISLGSIYLVLFYVKQCRSPITEIFNKLEEMQTCMNSLKRINNILEEDDDEDISKGEDVKELNGDIEFKNVNMSYGKEPVLKNVSFTIKRGSKVTIAGKTGVGKSTLMNVLMRLYDINSGQIFINGYDISRVRTKSLRDNISYISQTPYVFEDTLRNNITLGNSSISDSEILSIIKEVEVEKIYNRFRDGLETKIKEDELSVRRTTVNIIYKSNCS